jgi:LysR family hydrogen peroxide-inducible transcriptional activator
MEMRQLRYFAAVAASGNLTHAAVKLGVSQPTLSQQLAKLEKELGLPLFERLGRGVRLTAAGVTFRDYAGRILALAEQAQARVTDDPDRGTLTVGAIPTVAPYFLPGLLTAFAAGCPGARLNVVEEPTARLAEMLAAGEIDLGIVATADLGETVRVEPLFDEELLVVLPRGHPLGAAPKVAVKELSTLPFVLLNEAHCLTGTALSFCARHAVSPVVAARAQQLATVLELVRLGHGVSLVPAMATRGGHPGCEFRPVRATPPVRTIAAAWGTNRYQTRLFLRFLAAVRGYATPAPR